MITPGQLDMAPRAPWFARAMTAVTARNVAVRTNSRWFAGFRAGIGRWLRRPAFGLASAILALPLMSVPAQAQPTTCHGRLITGLDFRSPVLISGTALTPGSVYRFSGVYTGIDALVSIDAYNNGATLSTIDRDTGLIANFQPELAGSDARSVDFTISFVNAGGSTPVALDIAASGIDIDGDSASLREYAEFSTPIVSYILETPTNLDVNASGPSVPTNIRFETRTSLNAPGIDPTATGNIVSVLYTSTSSFRYRIGTLGTGATTRLTSLDFSCPVISFPTPNQIVPQDFGDAPASYGDPAHDIVAGEQLGPTNTAEPARYNSPTASGDAGDDGVVISSLVLSQAATATVTVQGSGIRLQAWFDWNGDGDFADAGELVASNVQDNGAGDTNPAAGTIGLAFTVPASATTSLTFARFRWASQVSLGFDGIASDGEVEDYAVTPASGVATQDFGDALLSYGNPIHDLDGTRFMGATNTGEAGPYNDPNATGDTGDDGVAISSLVLSQAGTASITAQGQSGDSLQAWFDWNGDGDFADAGEQVATDIVDNGAGDTNAAAGTIGLAFTVPAAATTSQTIARFRWASQASLGFDGSTTDGEVEDYAVTPTAAAPNQDFGDAPASYGNPIHDILAGFLLGPSVTAELAPYNHPTASADGADDGVIITPMVQFQPATATVTVQGAGGMLQGWIDWNGDGDFADPSEQIAADISDNGAGDTNPAVGTIGIAFTVPGAATTSPTISRFRWSSIAGLGFDFVAPDGEVEDYPVTPAIAVATEDYGDAPASYGNPVHTIDGITLLGPTNTADAGPYNSPTASGDLGDDGVTISALVQGQVATATVTVQGVGSPNLQAWFDWNGDGDFADAGEQVATNIRDNLAGDTNPAVGVIGISYTVPATATTSLTFARFRLANQSNLGFDGASANGEVEDFAVTPASGGSLQDFGDAPASYGNPIHDILAGFLLGPSVTAELAPYNHPVANADGGDDGVTIPPMTQFQAATATITVQGAGGMLQGWIDWNADGDFADPGEQIAADISDNGAGDTNPAVGTIGLAFTVPGIAVTSPTISRFRWSSIAGLGFDSNAPDGEVEDYPVVPLIASATEDYGDAPASYGNPVHTIDGSRQMGATNTAEAGPYNSPTASGDLGDDGVAISALEQSQTATATVTVQGSGSPNLQAWFDWNGDGDFADAGEQVATNVRDNLAGDTNPAVGIIGISFTVPATATTSLTFARFRWANTLNVGFDGAVNNGEVEDYAVTPESGVTPHDYGDAPAVYGNPVHDIVAGVLMGPTNTAEAGPYYSPTASGDTGDDGVTMGALTAGSAAKILVVVQSGQYLQAWFDWNGDGDFTDSGEQVVTDMQDNGAGDTDPTAGVILFIMGVPSGASQLPTFSRFRWSSTVSLGFDGFAADGEVEDYLVTAAPAAGSEDFGDAPASYGNPVHEIDSNWLMGATNTPEAGPYYSPTASGDAGDDGVTISALATGQIATATITIDGGSRRLQAWFDWNGDGDFADAGEQVATNLEDNNTGDTDPTNDIISIAFIVPPTATTGQTFARFRWAEEQDLGFDGTTSKGEVEDYLVTLTAGPPQDFGDAPAVYGNPVHNIVAGILLGPTNTSETAPYYSPTASGDAGDDGVTISPLYPSQSATATVAVQGAGDRVQAWIDWNGDGDFTDGGEQVATDVQDNGAGDTDPTVGVIGLAFSVPGGATNSLTFARFRWSTTAGLGFDGFATDGEVEDYGVTPGPPADYGDAPASYGNPVHEIDSNWLMGATNTPDIGPYYSPTASGDTGDDGVTISALATGQIATATITIDGGSKWLQAWFDWNGDGDFADAGEQVVTNLEDNKPGDTDPTDDIISIAFIVPPTAATGQTFARFRWSDDEDLGFDGSTSKGEVEDYLVTLTAGPPPDYGDAPASYGNPIHIFDGTKLIGATNTGETGPYYSPTASGDAGDDGVTISPLYPSQSATATVIVQGAGDVLQGWIDWNGDGDFTDGGEQIATDVQDNGAGDTDPTVGTIGLSFSVPGGATTSLTFARFRWSSQTGLGFDGIALEGEVEDYAVTPGPPADYGDAPASYGNPVHEIDSNWLMGATNTPDIGPYYSPTASGDTGDDGVTISALVPGQAATATITIDGGSRRLQAWFDWNGDGDFADAGEQVVTNLEDNNTGDTDPTNDIIGIAFTVPASATTGQTFARFRWAEEQDLGFDGSTSKGEVEDYFVTVGEAELTLAKTSAVYDPASAGLFSIPGSDRVYSITATNIGPGPVDTDSIFIVDTLPSEVDFYNGDMDDGGPATGAVYFTQVGAGLTFTLGTDVAYSDLAAVPANFAACTYVPSAGYDPNVRHVCVNPKGAMLSGSPSPTFTLQFRARIQ